MPFRLTPSERRALLAVELLADTPITQLAQRSRMQPHTLRYAVERLIDRGVLRRRPFINVYPLGLADYAIYFSLSPEKESAREQLLSMLAASDRVSWLAAFGGEYHYGMAVVAPHVHAVRTFLEEVSTQFPGIFSQKSLSVRTALTLISRKYLAGTTLRTPTLLRFGYTNTHTTLDLLDHSILFQLEENPESSLREVAERLRTPFTTVQQRVSALKKSGVLVGAIYQVDALAYGAQAFRLVVETKSVSESFRTQLAAFALAHPSVCYFIECLGAWDYELGVEVERAEEVIDLHQSLAHTFGAHLISVTILPLFGHRKVRNYPMRRAPF